LKGAFDSFTDCQQYEWIRAVPNSDPEYGGARYLHAVTRLGNHRSEEYSQALASVLFAHIWLLSAANYFRLSCKHKIPPDAPWLSIKPIEKTSSPDLIAKELKLHACVIRQAEILHAMRNTITHLVETDRKTAPIEELDFPTAFRLVKAVWVIYIALLRHYGVQADAGRWASQTKKHGLPRKTPR